MQIFREKEALQNHLSSIRGKVGFVPTMGALHQGHLQLVREAKRNADYVVASVFVNPTQFNNSDDLKNYPRDEEGDRRKLESAGCHAVWFPTEAEMYPNGTKSEHFELGRLEEVMEGEFRPGHFQGVATIVDELFKSVKPDCAIFGEKDFQQVAVIRRMASLKNHHIEIIAAPTIREPDGLAMSSRNLLLKQNYRDAAPVIHRMMTWASENKHNHTPAELTERVIKEINAAGLEVEYVRIADSNSLEIVHDWNESNAPRVFVAAFAGSVRLIDNLSLN
ncbi:pantoate--beta-alanine ligase [Phaeocystidibacter luteus]|uniref:Pantothenate synthetase n=1 Tax=Phaeocystidibacter luteus TaxID=911197 RepID=A0A6N6RJ41_9FLAO|nr:pantoate--beta-alanine ligase [Phaeocystidibacter luteus]KAB2813986.1 pantoate--beta-alanine ligase [Phaeocystidibacter luteus]